MSDNLILPIPVIPPEIKNAVDTKTLAVFVGAGVSRLIGCKGWDDLVTTVTSTTGIDPCPLKA